MRQLVPSEFRLSQNYPKPFSDATTIKFCLPCRARVRVDIVHAGSGVIRRLCDEERGAGTFEIGLDSSGLPEGSYVCVFQAGDFVSTKRMQLKR